MVKPYTLGLSGLVATCFLGLTAQADPAPGVAPIALDTIRNGEARTIEVEYRGYVPPASWLPQILGGKAMVKTKLTPDRYEVDSRVTAAGIVDWFIDYSSTLTSKGRVTQDGLVPIRYNAVDDEGRKNRHTKITRNVDDNVVDVVVTPPHGSLGDPPATMAQKVEAVDPMAALAAMAVNPRATSKDPCTGTVPIFDGKGRYNLHLTFGKHLDKIDDTPGWSGPVYVCNVKYEEVAGYKKKTADQMAALQRDLKWLAIVLADMGPGEPAVPIKIEGRSDKRGKISLKAHKVTMAPLDQDQANIDLPGDSRS